MSNTQIRPEKLNAYVDGELSRRESAEIARAAAEDPSLAARIATLKEMKAAVSDIVPDQSFEFSIAKPRPRFRTAAATAAGLVLMVAAAGLFFLRPAEDSGTDWARALQHQHAQWQFTYREGSAPVAPVSAVSSLLPLDLKAARLSFAGQEEFIVTGEVVQRIGYKGTRGCRVSLFVYPAGVILDVADLTPSLRVRSWAIREYGFTLMADGMAQARFDGVASAVEKALRSGLEFDAQTRQRLAHARRTSAPCRA